MSGVVQSQPQLLPESEEELARETTHCAGMAPPPACGWEVGCLCPQGPPSVLPIGRELSPVHTLRLPTLITQPPNSPCWTQGLCPLRPAFSSSAQLRGCSAPSPVTGLCDDSELGLHYIPLARYLVHNIALTTSSKPLKRLLLFC